MRRAEAASLSHTKTNPVFGFHGNSRPRGGSALVNSCRTANTRKARNTTLLPVCGLKPGQMCD